MRPNRYLDTDGTWLQLLTDPAQTQGRAALFLDRDGVLVEEVEYLHRAEDAVPIPGAAEIIGGANRRGVPVVIVSNQSGIARGYYGWTEFGAVQRAILRQLRGRGASVDAVVACPHYPDHPDRKPRPGMLLKAADRLGLDRKHSWIAGDKPDDLLAGRAAGLRGGILVLTGHGRPHRAEALALETEAFRAQVENSLGEAGWVLDYLSPWARRNSAAAQERR